MQSSQVLLKVVLSVACFGALIGSSRSAPEEASSSQDRAHLPPFPQLMQRTDEPDQHVQMLQQLYEKIQNVDSPVSEAVLLAMQMIDGRYQHVPKLLQQLHQKIENADIPDTETLRRLNEMTDLRYEHLNEVLQRLYEKVENSKAPDSETFRHLESICGQMKKIASLNAAEIEKLKEIGHSHSQQLQKMHEEIKTRRWYKCCDPTCLEVMKPFSFTASLLVGIAFFGVWCPVTCFGAFCCCGCCGRIQEWTDWSKAYLKAVDRCFHCAPCKE